VSDRYGRLRGTATLGGEAFGRWAGSRTGVIGNGVVGSRYGREVVRSGASVLLIDKDDGEVQNLGTQDGIRVGEPKATALAAACDEIAPGRADAFVGDVRHVGLATLAELDLLVDATDDPALAQYLTEVSNGLGLPLMRIAIDGSGASELGRVLTSHGGAGHACQLCSWSPGDLLKRREVTPCPGRAAAERPSTLAGGAIGMAVAGLGLLQAQRLLGGNDTELVLDREVRLDLSHFALLPLELTRSEDCLSGHETWTWTDIPIPVAQATVADVLAVAAATLGTNDIAIEPFGHALRVGAPCACGRDGRVVGTSYFEPPACTCGRPTEWLPAVVVRLINHAIADELGILDRRLLDLGLPPDGALFLARCAGRPPRRLYVGPTITLPCTELSHA